MTEPEALDSTPAFEGHGWVRPGATYLHEGETGRLVRIESDRVEGVSASGTFSTWSRQGFAEALGSGQICFSSRPIPLRAPPPPRPRVGLTEGARAHIAVIRTDPLLQGSGDDLLLVVMRTLQALRTGVGIVRESQLWMLAQLAQAGAEQGGYGHSVAEPARGGGRPSPNATFAREVQDFLLRFEHCDWEVGELTLGDLDRLRHLCLVGLDAIQDPSGPTPKPTGRPSDRLRSVRAVQNRLALRQRAMTRGTYRLSDAIREVAEAEVLRAKRAATAWRGEDPDRAVLGSEDAESLRLARLRIERAYHKGGGPPSAEACREQRRYAAALLWLLRRRRRAEQR